MVACGSRVGLRRCRTLLGEAGVTQDCGGRVIHEPSVQRTKSPTAAMSQAQE